MIKRAPHSSPLYLDISIPRFSEKYNLFIRAFGMILSPTPRMEISIFLYLRYFWRLPYLINIVIKM